MSKGKYVKRTFPLAGLHCAGCAARVEKILNAQTGVVAASVNLAASTAAVEYDTMQTSPERLRQAVQEGGYDMLADSDDDTPDELERMNRERYRDLKRRSNPSLCKACKSCSCELSSWLEISIFNASNLLFFTFIRCIFIRLWLQNYNKYMKTPRKYV